MKVTIIGASISGLFSAYLLAKEGVEVEVCERGDVLGPPRRTLIVTSKLKEVLGFVPEEAITNEVKYLEIFSRSRSVRLELSSPDLIVQREKLVKVLAHRAEEAGARIILKHQFQWFLQAGGKVAVGLRNLETGEEWRNNTDILVGADGVSSAVAQAASCDGHYLTALLQARVALPENIRSDTCQVWFDSNQTRFFYWLFPESQASATVGLIADEDQQAKAGLEVFLKERKLEPLEFQAGAVPLHRFKWIKGGSVQDRNVFLVGDAAALVKVTTLGGVVTGLYGARALANALLGGKNYRKELRGLKLELDLHLIIRNVMNRFGEENYEQLIDMLQGRLKGVLEESTRDELRTEFIKLILSEPRLIILGAKGFLKSIVERGKNKFSAVCHSGLDAM